MRSATLGWQDRRLMRPSGWWIASLLLWIFGRLIALSAMRAFDTVEVLPLELTQGLVQDILWVSACFVFSRSLALSQHKLARKMTPLPGLALALSAAIRVIDGVHCLLGQSHITVGFWWQVSWSSWPLLLESGALSMLGLLLGLAWFAWRATRLDLRSFLRRAELRHHDGEALPGDWLAALDSSSPPTTQTTQSTSVLTVFVLLLGLSLGTSLIWPPPPHHQGLLPEANLLHTFLAFHGLRVPPSAQPPDDLAWSRWQAAGWVPLGARKEASLPLWSPPQKQEKKAPAQAHPPLNVLVVFLESFNRALTSLHQSNRPWMRSTHLAASLTPHFAHLATRMTDVQGYYTQARPTHFGIVTSLCGLLPGSWPLDVNLRGRPLPRLSCLPAWLSSEGYHTSFVQGSSLKQTGLDRTLSAMGFQDLHGRERLAPRYPEAPRNAWGMQDRQTFAYAIEKLERYRADKQPFLLTISTVDSHYPGASHPDCRPPPEFTSDRVLRAIYCADVELAALESALDRLDLWRDTLIVLTADHAIQALPEVRALVGKDAAGPFAELPLLIHDPRNRLPRRVKIISGQTDLAPTLSKLLDLKSGMAAQGHDLFGDRRPNTVFLGLMGRRAVGVRIGARHRRYTFAELGRQCENKLPLLAPETPSLPTSSKPPLSADQTRQTRPGDVSACDVLQHLYWLDGLWFEDRIAPVDLSRAP